jgi:hypothetical protein
MKTLRAPAFACGRCELHGTDAEHDLHVGQNLPDPFTGVRPRSLALGDWCHRCGHVHEGVSECGVDMGSGRVCPCQLEGVPR